MCQTTLTVAASRSTSSQPTVSASPIRTPVASMIRVRSGRSQVRAFSLLSKAASQVARRVLFRLLVLRFFLLSIRSVSRTRLAVMAPFLAATRSTPAMSVLASFAVLTDSFLNVGAVDRTVDAEGFRASLSRTFFGVQFLQPHLGGFAESCAASPEELWKRISERNKFHENDPNSVFFAESDLKRYCARFFPPTEDEPHLLYANNPEIVEAWEKCGI